MANVKTAKPLAVTIEQAGQLIGISRNLAYQMAKEGRIPTIRLGKKRLLVPLDSLKRLLMSSKEG